MWCMFYQPQTPPPKLFTLYKHSQTTPIRTSTQTNLEIRIDLKFIVHIHNYSKLSSIATFLPSLCAGIVLIFFSLWVCSELLIDQLFSSCRQRTCAFDKQIVQLWGVRPSVSEQNESPVQHSKPTTARKVARQLGGQASIFTERIICAHKGGLSDAGNHHQLHWKTKQLRTFNIKYTRKKCTDKGYGKIMRRVFLAAI